MKRPLIGISSRTLAVILVAARGVLIAALLVSLPFLFEFLSRGIEWIWGSWGISGKPWEALLWFR